MLDFAIFAVTFLTVLLVAIIWLYPSSKRVTTIPGLDPSSKDDGNLSDIKQAGSLHEFLQETHARFGPITGFWWGQTYVVSIASPELFKQHAAVFDRPAELFRMFEPLFGPLSIQTANGSEGRSRRQHYDRAFAHERFEAFYERFQELSDSVAKKWLEKAEQEEHVPLSEHMFDYAIKAALLTLLGESFTDEKLVTSVRNAYDKAWAEMENNLNDSILPADNSTRVEQFQDAVKYLKSTVKKVIGLAEKHWNRRESKILIDDIMEYGSNEEIIAADVLTYMVGAFHTTSNLLTWCLYFLATHADVQDKVHREVRDKLAGNGGRVTQENIGQLSYLTQVLNESLRCAVVAPWGARVQDFDSELGGHKIPKGTPVIHAFGVVHQDEKLWPMPNRFDPDRFSPENSQHRGLYEFVPFGFAGKRKCPGYKFSLIEATVLLATLVHRFEVHLWNDQVVQPVHGLVTHPEDEIWIKVTKRS